MWAQKKNGQYEEKAFSDGTQAKFKIHFKRGN